jgi:fatty acid desaturase
LPVRTAPTTDYGELKLRIKQQGLLEPQVLYYHLKTFVALLLVSIAVFITVIAPAWPILLADAVLLGFASTQVALLAHDVGHWQGFRGVRSNAIARFIFGNVLLGVSYSWWNIKHNQHHATPNHVDKDPDIQFSMLVFSVEQIASRPTWLRPLIAIQAFLLLFLLPFQALNMRISSVQHLFSAGADRRWLQAFGMMLHFALYGALLFATGSWLLAIAFFAIHQATFGVYNSSVFASNHKGMPVISADGRLDFLREQVLTSRNVTGHWLTDFWYGGLNYQIEHHLFPKMPRNNLQKAQATVRAFCEERGISYHATGLFASYREVLVHLHQTSASLRRAGKTAAA